jgi:alpha-D-xyloside xylohydrolase
MKGVKGLLLAPHDGEILIPVVHSSLGYVFLFNLPSLGTVEYNDTTSHWHADAVLQADIWVSTTDDGPVYSKSPWSQLQSAYADATGHAPVWPAWTTGFWQCKLRYSNQSQIMDVVQEHLDRQIPISLIIIDFYNWNDPAAPADRQNTLGDETLPATCWPDPKQMVQQLKERGVELMVSPYSHSVSKTSKNYETAALQGLLALDKTGQPALGYAGGYVYDLFNPAARSFAWGKMQDGYIEQYGLHHWWLDCDEPCGGTNNGTFGNDFVYNNGTWPAAFVGAAYPHMLDRMVFEGEGAPGKEYALDNVMLGRSAWAGSQRFGGAVWSGDTSSTWDDFNQQFRAGLNMAMSGIPYWTTDIGGFGGGDTTSPDFRELIVRWFQWGAFCPLFRLHGARNGPTWPPGDAGLCGASPSNEIWMFGNESEEAIVRVMRLREQLRPYVLAQFQEAAKSGTPIMRPLFFDFWEDAGAQGVDDAYMFGPDYLVAPVLTKGATSRFVYLPPLTNGTVWRNVFTGTITNTAAGGRNISEPTPLTGDGLSTFPLYQRIELRAHA